MVRGWPDVDGLAYGGDYNPEQWPTEVWPEDVRLMREAGVNLVTVGVFSWAWLEPEEGRYEFGWLDLVLDLLHGAGVAVDLATATASPPPWFSAAYPQSLPARADGTRLWWGSRQAFCPSSADYRVAAGRLVEQLAKHYAGHPALALWHVHNEYGCHNAHCYCDTTAEAFRRWLQERYGDVDALNAAWATSFWSQRYGDWAQVLPPRQSPTWRNPGQQLDFWRFSSDELLACYRAERDVLRAGTPDVPVTTNFMSFFKPVDYWSWAPELDVVSNDHYLIGEEPSPHVGLSMSADLMRSLAGGRPWLLMEHSTSAVNWQPRNVAKAPGQLRRNSLAHVARGADGTLFFQWRASRGGAEKFHSGLVPHAGTDTKVWREVCELGANLAALAEVRGSTVRAEVAIGFDWSSWWAAELDSHPSTDVVVMERVRAWYDALWRAGVTVDFARPDADLSAYRVVLLPNLYLVGDAAAANLRRYVEGGGTLVVGYFSGIVDETDAVRLGGYPGAFRDVLGLRVEEFFPLRSGEAVGLDDGTAGRVWSELGAAGTAEVLAVYAEGPVAGSPAVTRNAAGRGTAWYVGTSLESGALDALLARVCAEAGVTPSGAPPGVEVVRRHGVQASYLFVLNHTDAAAAVAARGIDLVTGAAVSETVNVPAGGVAVVRESTRASADASTDGSTEGSTEASTEGEAR